MARIHIRESLAMSMNSLWSNKMRSLLTLLGIIIGVLTIITVISVIQGLNNYVYSKLSFYGANDFSVTKFSLRALSLEELRKMQKRKDILLEDMRIIQKKCRACEIVGASVESQRTVSYRGRSVKSAVIRGVTYQDHLIGAVTELESGRHLLREDEFRSRTVCVIGGDIAEKLFPYQDPLGKFIRIGPHRLLVIGVGEKKGKILGFSQDNYIRVPITTFHKYLGSIRSININIHTASQEQMKQAQDEIRTLLRAKRHLRYNEEDDFSFQTSETFINIYKTATTGIYFAMIAISSIALLVGGIVVMNIMLVSVTERIKEIGIRMAVGARRSDILLQFLIESASISTVGGIIGILIGFTLARIISAVTSMPSALDPVSIVVAILVSCTVGIFFGLYPAGRAARLNPIDALRSEQ